MKHHQIDRSLKGSSALLSVEVCCPEKYMRTQKFKESALVETLMGFLHFKLEDLVDCAFIYTAREGSTIEYSIKVILGTKSDPTEIGEPT
jgi:hypothetical protein